MEPRSSGRPARSLVTTRWTLSPVVKRPELQVEHSLSFSNFTSSTSLHVVILRLNDIIIIIIIICSCGSNRDSSVSKVTSD
jgi:hypothetical protein